MAIISADWHAPANIHTAITTKLSWPSHDLPRPVQISDLSNANAALISLLSLPQAPCWLLQQHTTTVCELPYNEPPIADASFTTANNTVCIVTTADCLPVLISSKDGSCIAAVHAGWRGLCHGIIENTVHALPEPAANLLIWLGPCIGPTHFEVGADVFTAFCRLHPGDKIAFKPIGIGKWLADLYLLAQLRLERLGVLAKNIYVSHFCTYSDEEKFYSYRRDQGKTGHIASLIWKS